MSKFTEKQKEQMLDAARKRKTIKQICEDFNLYMPAVRAFLGDAVSKKIIPPMLKERKKTYHKAPEPSIPAKETQTQREAKAYKANFESLPETVIKLKPLPYKSIFDVRI